MADYSTPGEFQGTLGQGQALWAVLEGQNIVLRPEIVVAGTTSTATQGQSVDTWSGAPPAGAFAIPVWQMGGGGGGGASSVTVLNSGGAFGTISTSRTWTLSSAGDSVLVHLDAPISVAATATTQAVATAADPSYAEGTTQPLSQDLSGHIRTLTNVTVSLSSASSSIVAHLDAPVSVAFPATQNVIVLNSAGAFGSISVSNFPVSQNVVVTNSVGVWAQQAGTWTVNTIPIGSVGSITVLQGSTPWQVLSIGSVGTISTIPIGSMGTILVNQGTNPWTIINQTSVGTVLVTQGTTPWTTINQTSVGTVLVLQGGAPWSVTNLTSVGTVTIGAITSSVGVSATIVGQPINVINLSSVGTVNVGTLTSITSSVGVSATIVGQPISTVVTNSVGVAQATIPWIDNPTVITSGDQAFAVGSRQPISQTSSGKVIISGADFPNTTIPTYGLVMAGSAGAGFNLSGKTQMITATPIPLQGSTSSTGMEMSLATRTRQYFGNKATYSVSAATSVGVLNQQTTSVAYLFHHTTDAKRYQLNRIRVSASSASGGGNWTTIGGYVQVSVARLSSEGSGTIGGSLLVPLAHDPGDASTSAIFRVSAASQPKRISPDLRTSLVQLNSPNEYDFDFTSIFEGKPLICPSGTSSGYEVRAMPLTNIPPSTSVACSFTWTEELATTQ